MGDLDKTDRLRGPSTATIVAETDWIGSRPVFYNEQTAVVSTEINDVIDLAEMEIDREGLAAFLAAGYCVFGRTPVRHVRFLPPCSRLLRGPDDALHVAPVSCDLTERLERRSSVSEVLERLRAVIRDAERDSQGDIVVPTSGGYDSRLLNLMVEDRSRLRSFTYGLCEPQAESREVTRARELSRRLGVRWMQIPLGRFHERLDEWNALFGPAVHAHGMYHIEFYAQVAPQVQPASLLLTGSLGDWFAGRTSRLSPQPVSCPEEVRGFLPSSGLHADDSQAWGSWRSLREAYFETHRATLADARLRLIDAVRLRVMLLHYLVKIPEWAGLRPLAPYADIGVATAMLTLPEELREGRRWEAEYFVAQGADVETAGTGNDWTAFYGAALRRVPVEPLDVGLLREVVRPDYVAWVNRQVRPLSSAAEAEIKLVGGMQRTRGLRRAGHQLRRVSPAPQRLPAYHAYMTLFPLQRLLQRRDLARRTSA